MVTSMVYLIDTNVIIRFFVGNEQDKDYNKSVQIISEIEQGMLQVEILSEVVMEVIFVMTKFYKSPLDKIALGLKELILLDGVVNKNKYILVNTIDMMVEKNIDFVDALICSKAKLQNYGKISFDKDVVNKCER
jgi:predicted nucleic-acid-binding protein